MVGEKPYSKEPKNKRKAKVDNLVIEFIKQIRLRYGDMGKEKIKILLDEFCRNNNLKPTSASTVGRIIKRKNFYFHKEYTQARKEDVKISGDLMQIDSITLI